MLHVVSCIVWKGCSELLFCCMLALGCCTLRSCGVRAVACCTLLPLHPLGCIVSAARCIARVGCSSLRRATVRRACVQGSFAGGISGNGGVLSMSGGSATFESVAISDTKARVRVESGRPIGSAAELGGGAQDGGVVEISGGSVLFKGGSIARAWVVRILVVDHCVCRMVAWGALYVASCVVFAAHYA